MKSANLYSAPPARWWIAEFDRNGDLAFCSRYHDWLRARAEEIGERMPPESNQTGRRLALALVRGEFLRRECVRGLTVVNHENRRQKLAQEVAVSLVKRDFAALNLTECAIDAGLGRPRKNRRALIRDGVGEEYFNLVTYPWLRAKHDSGELRSACGYGDRQFRELMAQLCARFPAAVRKHEGRSTECVSEVAILILGRRMCRVPQQIRSRLASLILGVSKMLADPNDLEARYSELEETMEFVCR